MYRDILQHNVLDLFRDLLRRPSLSFSQLRALIAECEDADDVSTDGDYGDVHAPWPELQLGVSTSDDEYVEVHDESPTSTSARSSTLTHHDRHLGLHGVHAVEPDDDHSHSRDERDDSTASFSESIGGEVPSNHSSNRQSNGQKKRRRRPVLSMKVLLDRLGREDLKYGRDNGRYLVCHSRRILRSHFEPSFVDLLQCHVRSTGLMLEHHVMCRGLPVHSESVPNTDSNPNHSQNGGINGGSKATANSIANSTANPMSKSKSKSKSNPNSIPKSNPISNHKRPRDSRTEDVVFRVVDVGGHRNERKKWDYVLRQSNDVIVFVVSAASFCQVLFEDFKENAMRESLAVWKHIVSTVGKREGFTETPTVHQDPHRRHSDRHSDRHGHRHQSRSQSRHHIHDGPEGGSIPAVTPQILLVINKMDLFEERFHLFPRYFPEFDVDKEGADKFAVLRFIKELYLDIARRLGLSEYVHCVTTKLTDSMEMATVDVEETKDVLLAHRIEIDSEPESVPLSLHKDIVDEIMDFAVGDCFWSHKWLGPMWRHKMKHHPDVVPPQLPEPSHCDHVNHPHDFQALRSRRERRKRSRISMGTQSLSRRLSNLSALFQPNPSLHTNPSASHCSLQPHASLQDHLSISEIEAK